MKHIVYALRANNGKYTSRCMEAMRSRMGGTAGRRDERCPEGTTLLVHWGFKMTPALRSAVDMKIPFVILDRGYFDPWRVNRASISFNGHHGMSMVVDVLDRPPRDHPDIKPWHEGGERVYILGQVHGDASLRGLEVEPWLGRTAVLATETFGKPAVKRPHPLSLEAWDRHKLPPLDSLYDDMYVCVTYSSTSGVQTLMNGVPTVALHPASPAWIAPAKLSRAMPAGREAWAHTLAYREYDLLDSADCDAACAYIESGYKSAKKLAALGAVDLPRK